MKYGILFVRGLGYGAFVAWLAAIWCKPIRMELGLTGLLMFVLFTLLVLGQQGIKSGNFGKNGK